jgi:hypothetical protein
MCAMDRIAHFLMGHLAPPPMGQTATPTAKTGKRVCKGVYLSAVPRRRRALCPYASSGIWPRTRGRDSAPSGKEPTPQQYTLLEGSADGPNGSFLFHLDYLE